MKCEACKGTGLKNEHTLCPVCNGYGIVDDQKSSVEVGVESVAPKGKAKSTKVTKSPKKK